MYANREDYFKLARSLSLYIYRETPRKQIRSRSKIYTSNWWISQPAGWVQRRNKYLDHRQRGMIINQCGVEYDVCRWPGQRRCTCTKLTQNMSVLGINWRCVCIYQEHDSCIKMAYVTEAQINLVMSIVWLKNEAKLWRERCVFVFIPACDPWSEGAPLHSCQLSAPKVESTRCRKCRTNLERHQFQRKLYFQTLIKLCH